jgi:hypothetical protein
MVPAEKFSVWSAEGLPSMLGAGGWWAGGLADGWWLSGSAGQRSGGLVAQWVGGGLVDGWRWCGGGGPPVLSVYRGVEKPSTG